MQKERFGSRLGFILVTAGCAIGLGNVWRFPYIVGKNGGAIFVLIYLAFLVIMGIPIMATEFAVGRAAQTSPISAFETLTPKKKKWSFLGKWSLIGSLILVFYYTVIGGWMLNYVFKSMTGELSNAVTNSGQVFDAMLANPGEMIFWTLLTILIGFGVCYLGFNKGVEKTSTVMMTALMVLIIVLVFRAVTLPNAVEGIKFYLVPDWDKMHEVGIGTILFEAMNQAFFTLSIGIGAMAIFGSRIDKERSLLQEGFQIGVLDTFIAIMSGLIIFPAAASYGVSTGEGPGLIFVTLPQIFAEMSGGRIWGSLFFLFMSFAALSTVIAVFENIIACFMDWFDWSRKKAIGISFAIVLIMSLPVALGYNVLSGVQPLGEGSTILDFEDFIVSANLLPLGSLFYVIYAVSKRGWGFDNYLEEVNAGKGYKMKRWMKPWMQFGIPALILIIFVLGYYLKFFA